MLFHGTSSENAISIQKHGIRGQKGRLSEDHGVYVTEDLDVAAGFAATPRGGSGAYIPKQDAGKVIGYRPKDGAEPIASSDDTGQKELYGHEAVYKVDDLVRVLVQNNHWDSKLRAGLRKEGVPELPGTGMPLPMGEPVTYQKSSEPEKFRIRLEEARRRRDGLAPIGYDDIEDAM